MRSKALLAMWVGVAVAACAPPDAPNLPVRAFMRTIACRRGSGGRG